MLKLTLVRHAPTAWNEAKRYQGWGDLGLSTVGRARARRLAERLQGRRFDRVVCSDLRRARETAELIVPGQEVTCDLRLREMNFGAWEGLTRGECRKRFGERYRAWTKDPTTHPPPGGETLAGFEERVRRAADELPSAGTCLAVGHAGTMRILLSRALGVPFAATMRLRISGCALTEVELHPDGGATVLNLNDASHLAGLAEGLSP
ncbi:MAG: histidine phosphatase family protein [Longimicrobiaceae bacterium]